MVDDPSEHHMLRTDASAPARLHGTQKEKLDAVAGFTVRIRNVVHFRIQFVKLIVLSGSGTLFHQLPHLTDGKDGIQHILRKSKRQPQIGIRVHICGENRPSFLCI